MAFAIFMLIAGSTTAQTKSYFGLYSGLSIPSGDLGQNNYANNNAGFAKTGVTFAADGAAYFYKNLGFGATVSYQDQGELTDNDANILSAGFTTSYKADKTTVTAVDRYHNLNLLGGPQYSFTLNKFIIDLRASAGIVKVYSTPQIETELTGVPAQNKAFTQRSADGTIFGYGGDIGLRYSIGEHWNLGLKGAYVDTKGINIAYDNRSSTTGRYVTKQPISEIQATFGIVRQF